MIPDEQFVIHLRLEQLTTVLYVVRHCTWSPPDNYRIGAQLWGFVGTVEADAQTVLSALLNERLV